MSDLWAAVRAGEILRGEVVIDCHTHMGPWFNFSIPKDPWAEGMITAMDTCGIQTVLCSPHVGLVTDYQWGNRIIADIVNRYPDRFAGYCAVNPNYPVAEIEAELERYLVNGPLRGIKIHPSTHQYPADGPNYRPVWAFANEYRLPVLVHTWESAYECNPLMFVSIGKAFPHVPILLGHSGGPAKGMDQAVEAAAQWEHLYLDLTGSMLPRGMLEVLVQRVGADRVLFGTDIPFVDCRSKLGYVAFARIPDEDKRKILGLNTKRLFGL